MPKLALRPDGILDPEGRYPNPFTGKPYSEKYKEEARRIDDDGENQGWTKYITWREHKKIFKKLYKNQILLVRAPPGTGKTVIIPKLFAHFFGYQKPIICTTPRQKTTHSSANYASYLLDVNLIAKDESTNEEIDSGLRYVGYKYKDANMYDETTRILFSTDGSIKVMMTSQDPDLKEYAGIIIDEAHERNINIDILIALVIELCKRRPDFKVIIMSATIDSVVVENYIKRLNMLDKYDIYSPEGVPSNFKIDKEFASTKNIKVNDVIKIIEEKTDSILKNNTIMDKLFSPNNNIDGKPFIKYGRDFLIFVPLASNALQIKNFIDTNYKKGLYKYKPFTIVFTKNTVGLENEIATGKNGLEKIEESGDYQLKIIISTPVAESSITFGDPLAYVLEGGLAFSRKFDGKKYGFNMGTAFVTDANIDQRCGRTGRNNNGICIHIYSKMQFEKIFPRFPDPDIMHDDITSALLGITNLPDILNLQNCVKFLGKMIEPISNYKDNAKVCINNLLEYDCVDSKGVLSPLGKICNNFGEYNYQTVRLLIAGYNLGILNHTIFLASILSNVRSYDDMFAKPVGLENDEKLKDKFLNNMLEFQHESGDHLSLLNLYLKFLEQPGYDKDYFINKYDLKGATLFNIGESIKTLADAVKRNLKEIKKLRPLFKKYKNKKYGRQRILRGGGVDDIARHNSFTDNYGSLNSADLNLGNIVDKSKLNIDTKLNFSDYGYKPGCEKVHMDRVKAKSDIHINRGSSEFAKHFSTLFGGSLQDDVVNQESNLDNTSHNKDEHILNNETEETNYKKNRNTKRGGKYKQPNKQRNPNQPNPNKPNPNQPNQQNQQRNPNQPNPNQPNQQRNPYQPNQQKKLNQPNKPNWKAAFQKDKNDKNKGQFVNRGRGRGRGRGSYKGKGNYQDKGRGRGAFVPIDSEKQRKMEMQKKEKEDKIKKLHKILNKISMRGIFSNSKESLKDLDEKEQKKGLFDIGDYNSESIDYKLIVAIYFAYCTNIAVYAGNSDKKSKIYQPKFSDSQGKITKTTLGKRNKLYDFIVYHSFSLDDNFGNNLSIISHLPNKLVNKFMKN